MEPESNDASPFTIAGFPSIVTLCVIESSFVHEIVLPDDKLIWGGTNVSGLFGSAAPGAIDTNSWANALEYWIKLMIDGNINEIIKSRPKHINLWIYH